MNKVILQPSGNKYAREHYNDTMENSVSLDIIKDYVSMEEYNVLIDIYPDGECRVWGVTPGTKDVNVPKWNRIEVGDVTLFSSEGHIYASAVTTFKIHNTLLASKLWGYDNKKQTWEYIYFLDEVKTHKIPYKDFNRVVGYSDKYIIQGFNVLRVDQSIRVTNSFDLESDTYIEEVTIEAFEEIVSKLEGLEETEKEIVTTRRLEQGFLKRILFGNKTVGTCACCKKEYPISYLVTAHIKKRAFCSLEERKDVNVVMPMCKFGCDEIYEKGYISVSAGVFKDMNKTPTSSQLKKYIAQVDGTKCECYSDKNLEYFKWHFNHNQ